MAASTDLEAMNLRVDGTSEKAEQAIDKLIAKLGELKTAMGEIHGAKELESSIKELGSAAKLAGVDLTKVRFSKDIGTQLEQIADAMPKFTDESFQNLERFAEVTSKMAGVDLRGLGSAIRESNKVKSQSREEAEEEPPVNVPDYDSSIGMIKTLRDVASNALPAIKSLGAGIWSIGVKAGETLLKEFINDLKSVAKTAMDAGKKLASVAWNMTPFSKIRDTLSRATKALKQFQSSIMRIAMYRAIRTAMKELTEGLDQAIHGIYLFESAAGHKFASVMDGLKTNATEVTGNLGQLAANLLSLLAPALNTIMNLINQVVSALSSFFALLGGGVFVKATGSAQKFGDALSGGGKAAKEFKNQLLGFDEINRLEDSSGSDGGGGSGKINPYTFLEAELTDWMKAIKEAIDNSEWEKAGRLFAEHLNGILAKWDAKAWGREFGKKIEKGIEIGLGIVRNFDFSMLGQKIAQALNGIFEQVDGNKFGDLAAQWFNAPWRAINSFLTELNSANIGKFIGLTMQSWFANLDGNAISGAAVRALSTVLNTLENTIANFSLKDAVEKMVKTVTDTLSGWADVIKKSSIVTDLVAWVDEVDWTTATAKISASVVELLNAFVEKFKEIDKEKLASNIHDAMAGIDWGGIFADITEIAWQSFKLKWEARFAAFQGIKDSLVMSFMDIGGKYRDMVAEGTLAAADLSAMVEAAQNYNMSLDNVYQNMKNHVAGFPELSNVIDDAKNKINQSVDEVGHLDVKITNPISQATSQAIGNTNEIKTAATEAAQVTQEQIGSAIKEASADFNNAISEMETALTNFQKNIKGTFQQFGQDAKSELSSVTSSVNTETSAWQTSINNAMSGITSSFTNMAINAISAIRSIIEAVYQIPTQVNIAVRAGYSGLGTVRGYASGGFPETGELFVARENRLPEMVGTIGGQTAVANNGQIIEGISQGVYQAVTSAMSNTQNNGETIVKVYLDSREIKTGQQRYSRAMGI